MRERRIRLLLVLTLVFWLPCGAQALPLSELNLLLGKSFSDGPDFDRTELEGAWALPWNWQLSSGWNIDTRLLASVGALRSDGDSGALVSLGAGAFLASPSGRWRFEAGLRPTLLEDDDYNGYEIGGNVQFTSHLGITLRLTDRVAIGYRISHLSNADLEQPNPGVDFQQLCLQYWFP